MAERGQTVGFFSLEMSKEQLFIRLLTSEAKIDNYRLLTGRSASANTTASRTRWSRLSDVQLYIDDTPGTGVLEMRAKARRLRRSAA